MFNLTKPTTMSQELEEKFGKEHTIESLERLLKVVCTSELMTDYHLQPEIYVLFEIKELANKYLA